MRDPAIIRRLARLVPAIVREDVFLPAARDAHIDRLHAHARLRSGAARASAPARHAIQLLGLVLECWRIAIPELLHHRRERRRLHQPKELVPVLFYTIRHALRLLVRERGFTATAILTLGLGLGLNLAIFAVIEAVMLRPLPYEDAESLLVLNHRDRRTGISKEFIAMGDFIDLHERQTQFDALAAYGNGQTTITATGDPFRAGALMAGPGLLEALRVAPERGRLLTADDSRPGAAPVAMISQDLWERAYGSDPAVVGRTIGVGTGQRQIVGVAPRAFRFPAGVDTDVIVPLTLPPAAPANRKSGWVFAVARLKPGDTVERAGAHLETLSRALEDEFPQQNSGSLYYAVPLRDQLLGDTKRPLVLLLASVAVVLLIACANVGNLLLARGLSRRHEMSVRVALGAGRTRLVLQLLAESLVLALVAGAAGLMIAYWSVPALLALVPARLTVPGLETVGLNARVVGYALALCVLAAMAFALLSSATIRREGGSAALTSQTRVSGSRMTRRLTSGLIAAEIALSVVLLLGAGLILRSFSALLAVDPGFHIDRVAILDVQLPAGPYRDVEARRAFYRRAFEALGGMPGARTAGAAAVTPLTGNNWTVGFERADRPLPAGTRPPDVGWQVASSGYFKAIGIPLLSGRLFDASDVTSEITPVIISRTIEKQYFDGESAVGRKVRLGDGAGEIVGVVGDIRRASLTDAPRADMYFPFDRNPGGGISIFVGTEGSASGVLPAARDLLKSLEPGIVIVETRTLEGVASESIASTRLLLWLLGTFAAAAVALAGIGVYGVMSYVVSQRAREIGTRVALGATRRDILLLVLRQGGAISAAGLVVGLATALVLGRSLSSMLYGVSATDPTTIACAVGGLASAMLLACYLPALRATRVDAARTLAGD